MLQTGNDDLKFRVAFRFATGDQLRMGCEFLIMTEGNSDSLTSCSILEMHLLVLLNGSIPSSSLHTAVYTYLLAVNSCESIIHRKETHTQTPLRNLDYAMQTAAISLLAPLQHQHPGCFIQSKLGLITA